jgi:hypothetical protein
VATVTLRDETATGRALATTTLDDLPNLLTARELVRLRVRSGQPVDRARPVDWERQADVAEAAFARNGFVLLVGERQIESLDEVVDLSGDPVISFVRLIALMGG